MGGLQLSVRRSSKQLTRPLVLPYSPDLRRHRRQFEGPPLRLQICARNRTGVRLRLPPGAKLISKPNLSNTSLAQVRCRALAEGAIV